MIQLLQNKTGEIQSLLEHFKNQPDDLKNNLFLLQRRIESLSKDFEVLKKNFTETTSQTPVEDPVKIVPEISEAVIAPKEEKTETPVAPILKEPKSIESQEEKEEAKLAESVTLNDQLQSGSRKIIGQKLSSHKLEDIQSAIGINDRFLFIRELFENSADAYNSAISFINQSDNFETVQNWINKEKHWDMEDPTVIQFVEITKRKF